MLTTTAAIGIVFICGGIQGYQIGVGNLRASGMLEWPLRFAFIVGGFVLATPGGGIIPLSHIYMIAAAAAILVPAFAVARWKR